MAHALPADILMTVQQAAQRLAEGGLVAFPTETVYGLGADAENPAALARVYAVKGRPSNHPVIVHVSPEADLGYWARSVPAEARLLMQAFWPGPLTLILPRAMHISSALSGGQDSIGLRCPSHPVAQALLRRFARLKPGGQGGVAGPSANKFGHVSPTQAAHVSAEFPEMADADLMVLEGGAAEVGIESTIVDLSRLGQGMGPVLLRPGHVSAAQLGAVLGAEPSRPDSAAPRVSGSLKAHYAPRTPLLLLPLDTLLRQAELAALQAPGIRTAVVVFKAPLPLAAATPGSSSIEWHIAPADPDEYARDMYALLRRLDLGNYRCILWEQPPSGASWQAVNDRIGRAAAAFS
jgi:L-threonylcarbamoyladenylate synthase